jgi:photosystem II stability/assembly factor-like uncharacterized protein
MMRCSAGHSAAFVGATCAAFAIGIPAAAAAQATSAEDRLAAWAQHADMERTSRFAGLTWRAVGPRQAGARIEAIAVPSDQPSTIYVGVGSGNLWKSMNNGVTWTPIFEHESTFTIGDVAVAPSDSDVVWVGTGETQPRHSGYSYAGTGVFKSTDAGQGWQHMGLPDTHHIGKVLIHPTDPDIVYVAAIGHFWSPNEQRGVFRTTDGGVNWDKVLYLSDRAGVVDLVMDPSDPEILYAAGWETVSGTTAEAGELSGIFGSRDGGDSWAKLGGGLPTGRLGRIGLDVSASNPDVVYAYVDNWAENADSDRPIIGGEVYRSDDKGRSWRKTNTDDIYGVYGVYGWKFSDIRVSPDDENDVFILGNRAFHSSDGGQTFDRIGETIVRMDDTRGEIMHLDHHEIWIDPRDPDRVLLGNDGGLFQSWDHGASWLHHNNIPAAEFYSLWLDQEEPYRIFGGTQDNAALYGPSDTDITNAVTDPWENVYLDQWTGGDSFDTYVDPTDSRYVYYEHQHGGMRRMDITSGAVLTGDAQAVRPRAREGEPQWRISWYMPFLISRYDPSTLIAGANMVLKSENRGMAWRAISPDLSDPSGGERAAVPFGTITMIAESPRVDGLMYVGTEGGSVWRNRAEGGDWERVGADLPDRWVSRLVASQHVEDRVYVTMTGFRLDDFTAYAWVSEDQGESWTSIVSDLPDESINVIVEDPADADVLYVGTDLGVFVSLDRGASWEALSTTLPTTPVHDLDVHEREGELVAGTHGRSVWVLDLSAVRAAIR